MFTKSLDLFENGIGRRGPDEGARLGIVRSDEVFDFGHEFFDGAERAAADGLLRNDVEPDFDLIEPGGVGRGEVHLIPRVHGQPALNAGVLVLGWARYRTPLEELYLCGSGTHPGSGLTGGCGANAAREILQDWGKRS